MEPAAPVGSRGWNRWRGHVITVLLAIVAVVAAVSWFRVGEGGLFAVFILLGIAAPKRGLSITIIAALSAAAFILVVSNPIPPQPENCPECIHHESGLMELGAMIVGLTATLGTACGAAIGFLLSRAWRAWKRRVAGGDLATRERQA